MFMQMQSKPNTTKRTEWLNEQKQYRVIRFWNNEVLHNIEGVLVQISEALNQPAP